MDETVFYLNLNPQQGIILRKEGKQTDQEIAEMLLNFFQNRYGKDPYIAVSKKLNGIEELSVCLDNLEALLERRFYRPDIHIYLSEQESVETGRTHSVQVPDDDILTKQIHQDLKMKDLDSLKEHLACWGGNACLPYRHRWADTLQRKLPIFLPVLCLLSAANLPNSFLKRKPSPRQNLQAQSRQICSLRPRACSDWQNLLLSADGRR